MAQIKLTIGQVNITGYLIIVARKTTTPLTIEAQESFAPPHPATRNVVVPASGDIDPVVYYIDCYESGDGVAFDLLLSQFVYDLKNKIVISERRFYTVGGGLPTDPLPDQKILSDPYLDGKTISGVFKEGYRYLKPNTEAIVEWEPYPGGGIELQDPFIFSDGEVYTVEISYLADQPQGSGSGGLYSGVALIDTSITLNSGHRNKRLRCEASASNVLVVTLEPLASVPDGTFYHFTSNGGLQNQTRILLDGTETIKYNGENYTEMWISKGEYVRVVKTGSFWEGEMVHPGILQVGEKFAGTWNGHPNTKPENGALLDGDEWPRMWWWINNKLPSNSKFVDDFLLGPFYGQPSGQEGMFVLHSTQKKFRLPNTQGWGERGLVNFTVFGSDPDRVFDAPGGTQPGQVGESSFDITLPKGNSYNGGPNQQRIGNGAASPQDFTYAQTINAGKENIMKNNGVVYLRRF